MVECGMKYKSNTRLTSVIENCSLLGHRLLLLIHQRSDFEKGHAGEQVMIIHHLISKFCEERPSILWCHKKNAETPRVNRNDLKKLEMNIKNGKCDISTENAFHIFLFSTEVTFCSFNETQKVLGRTFGMCVIQDFEGLTPNVLCRITETVCGGGAIVILLPKTVSNMKDLFSLKMDIHSKLKTFSNPNVEHRFNKRFVCSLGWCKTCFILNEDLQVKQELVSSKFIKSSHQEGGKSSSEKELDELFESLSDAEKPLPQLAKLCCTVDQTKALLKMIDVITEKNSRATVSLSAGRGRGKSSVMGLATAAAVFFGINNIYVTSPSPENLATYFEYLLKGFDALEYEENGHYNIIQSTNPEFNNAIIRINVFARHRQVIQYVCPMDSQKVSQAELVVIDEAAAIPLPYVKALFGFHNVFMASTINGYEGTGRSLSLKLLKHLRQQTLPSGVTATSMTEENVAFNNCRPLYEVNLETSIRYQKNDPVEKWMHRLLYLEATSCLPLVTHCPHSESCELYYVNRDLLLSGHPTTEDFMEQIISLLVASHYRNSPDDLQILADSASHHLFVLLPPVIKQKALPLPTILSVVQVCVEGPIPTKISRPILERGKAPDGDLIPWSLASQFFTSKLTKLRGLRIVRVATHPDYQSMGYGTRAITLLKQYYHGKFVSLDEARSKAPKLMKEGTCNGDDLLGNSDTSEDPILINLNERAPETLDYIGVSYGITNSLFSFWKKLEFLPVNISQSINKMTGEHNCIMVYPITEEPCTPSLTKQISVPKWLKSPIQDFNDKFMTQLSGSFRNFSPQLAHNILSIYRDICEPKEISWFDLKCLMNGHDLRRIESYALNLSDRHLITDLLPAIASLIFNNMLPAVHLSPTQSGLLIGSGLQILPIEEVSKKLDLPIESTLGLFNRTIKRIFKSLSEIQEENIAKQLPKEIVDGNFFTPVTISLEQDLEETAKDYEASVRAPFGLNKFAVKGNAEEWDKVLSQDTKPDSTLISIKSTKRASHVSEAQLEKELQQPSKKGKRGSFNKSKNKRRN